MSVNTSTRASWSVSISAVASSFTRSMSFNDIADLSVYKMPMAARASWWTEHICPHTGTPCCVFLKASLAATALMQKDRRVFNAALAKWFNIKDAKTQDGMFAFVTQFQKKPYPSVEGIKRVFALYDSPEMRKRTPEEFYDSSLIAELDQSGFLDSPK